MHNFILMSLVFLMFISCDRGNDGIVQPPQPEVVVPDGTADPLTVLLFDELPTDSLPMVHRVYSDNSKLYVDALNKDGVESLFLVEDTVTELDISFLRTMNTRISKKIVFSNNHYIVFYERESEGRDIEGFVVIRDGQLSLSHEFDTGDSPHYWDSKVVDGILGMVCENYSNNEYKFVWYNGDSVQSVIVQGGYRIPDGFLIQNGVAKLLTQVGPSDVHWVNIDLDTLDISKVFEPLIGTNGSPELDSYKIRYAGSSVFFESYLGNSCTGYDCRTVFELTDSGALIPRVVGYNWSRGFSISNDTLYTSVSRNGGDYNHPFEALNLMTNIKEDIPLPDSGYINEFFNTDNETFLLNEYQDGNDWVYHLFNINAQNDYVSIIASPDHYIEQLIKHNQELLTVAYPESGYSSYPHLFKIENEELVNYFDQIDSPFGLTRGYMQRRPLAFAGKMCFITERETEESSTQELHCLKKGEYVKLETIEDIEPSYEYIDDVELWGDLLVIKTNYRLITYNQNWERSEFETLDLDVEGIVDNKLYYTRCCSNGLLFKNGQEDVAFTHPLIVDGSISSVNNIGGFILFEALRASDNNKAIYSFSDSGVVEVPLSGVWADRSSKEWVVFKNYDTQTMELVSLKSGELHHVSTHFYTRNFTQVTDTLFYFVGSTDDIDDYIFKFDISEEPVLEPIPISEHFAVSYFSYGSRSQDYEGEDGEDEEDEVEVYLDARYITSHNEYIYFNGVNENLAMIMFRHNTTTGVTEEFFHPKLNPRAYNPENLFVTEGKLFMSGLVDEISVGTVIVEYNLGSESTEGKPFTPFSFFKEDEMKPENFKILNDRDKM